MDGVTNLNNYIMKNTVNSNRKAISKFLTKQLNATQRFLSQLSSDTKQAVKRGRPPLVAKRGPGRPSLA